MNKELILIVDDCRLTLTAIRELIKEYEYDVIACDNAGNALELIREHDFNLVLTDIKMPEISGIELLEEVKCTRPDVPVILMTGFAELDMAVTAINKGAFDFILKPFNIDCLVNSIKKAIEYVRLTKLEKNYKRELESKVKQKSIELNFALMQMENINREVIQRFIKMAECRDTNTGDHISRIGLYSNKLAESLDMPEDFIGLITFASSMHDIGKIAIPDNILLKPAPLTPEEFEIMKSHTEIGRNILEGSSQPTIQMAESIAWSHHERWDGSGYPRGLKGEDIPVEGMIVMLADQYDALRNIRPYKAPLSHEEAYSIITRGDGRTKPEHFNPEILNAFIEVAPVFDEVFESLKDIHNFSNNMKNANQVLSKHLRVN